MSLTFTIPVTMAETSVSPVQCRHLIPVLDVWAAWAKYTTARPIATQFPGHGCMDDLTTGRSFDSLATWVIDVLGLFWTCYQWGLVQPGTVKRPVDWCRN